VILNLEGKLKQQPGYSKLVDSQKVMREDFAAIAKAGGGVYVDVEFTFTDQPPPPKDKKIKGKEKDRARDAGNAIASAATRRIVEHILVLSFGERFAAEMREFVRIEYDNENGVAGHNPRRAPAASAFRPLPVPTRLQPGRRPAQLARTTALGALDPLTGLAFAQHPTAGPSRPLALPWYIG